MPDMGGMGGGLGSAFGGILDAFGNMAKAHSENTLGINEENQANDLAAKSAGTVAPALHKEFSDALQTKQIMAASGIPDIETYSDQLDKHMADSVAKAMAAGGSGDSLLATISGLGTANENSELNLSEADAQAKLSNKNDLVNTLWKIGAERDNNDVIKRTIQSKLDAQAGALENAGVTNRYNAHNNQIDATTGLISSVYNAASSAAGGGGGASAGSSAKGYKQAGAVDPSQENPQDNTNLTADQQITGQTQSTDSNMDWTTFSGLGGMSAPGQ